MRLEFIIVLLVFLGGIPRFASASGAGEARRGDQAYREGRFDDALEAYMSALTEMPTSGQLLYNLGNVYYKKGEYGKAAEYFNRALGKSGVEESMLRYNLGNAIARQVESLPPGPDGAPPLEEAISLLKEARREYRNVVKRNPQDLDARHNFEVIQKRIEDLEKQKQEQEQQQQQQQQQPSQDPQDQKDPNEQQQQQGQNPDDPQEKKEESQKPPEESQGGKQDPKEQKEDSQQQQQPSSSENEKGPEDKKESQEGQEQPSQTDSSQEAKPQEGKESKVVNLNEAELQKIRDLIDKLEKERRARLLQRREQSNQQKTKEKDW